MPRKHISIYSRPPPVIKLAAGDIAGVAPAVADDAASLKPMGEDRL